MGDFTRVECLDSNSQLGPIDTGHGLNSEIKQLASRVEEEIAEAELNYTGCYEQFLGDEIYNKGNRDYLQEHGKHRDCHTGTG